MYSWWDGRPYEYIEARKRIYAPLYAEQVVKSEGYARLLEFKKKFDMIILLDYDAYDHKALGYDLTGVLNNPNKKMGHAFVLAMLLTRDPALKQIYLRS